MPEAPVRTAPSALVVGDGDTVIHASTHWRTNRRGPARCEAVYVVVHRGYGAWTHVYAVETHAARDRCEVRLLRVLAGDRLDEAIRWATDDSRDQR